ncbi:MAG TPA: NAD(P)-dependent oxidoreductase [Polyangiaceae bacterium]|jgi:nucleoside-diphosphate-sugar epimerase|nr:NAD(P)-dependent oxidoreductase [Polyangiaceae bacterium]
MSAPSTILVTGATGKLGTAVCRVLLDRGFSVRATDLKFAPDFPVRVELGDLRDELFVYRMVEGCDAVVHLGNHPNAFVGLSRQRLLSENLSMNANVFHAAVDLRIRSLVFASSVQAMVRRDTRPPGTPPAIPYLPLDGAVPCNPGQNTYAQSKEFAERMLRLLVESHPELSATSLRFPMLVTDWLVRRFNMLPKVPSAWIDFEECTAHLFLEDAGRLVADVLDRRLPGYHQYFPAQMMELRGYPLRQLVQDRYSHAELRKPLEGMASLIDVSAITDEVGWVPQQRLSFEVELESAPKSVR